MPDSAVTKNVFLDTEVFCAHHRNFASYMMRILVRLSARGITALFITSVTRDEIKSDLDDDAKKLFTQIKSFKRDFRLGTWLLPPNSLEPLYSLTVELIKQKLHDEFDKFLIDANVTVLGIDKISSAAIFQQYFKNEAPFGSGQKKSEFPDAFAFAALREWCRDHRERMYIVSKDEGI